MRWSASDTGYLTAITTAIVGMTWLVVSATAPAPSYTPPDNGVLQTRQASEQLNLFLQPEPAPPTPPSGNDADPEPPTVRVVVTGQDNDPAPNDPAPPPPPPPAPPPPAPTAPPAPPPAPTPPPDDQSGGLVSGTIRTLGNVVGGLGNLLR